MVRLQHDLLGCGALQTQKNMKNQTNKLTIAFVMCGKNINKNNKTVPNGLAHNIFFRTIS